MKRRSGFLCKTLTLLMIFGALTLTGCSGDDGANGLNGTNGTDGATGADGAPAIASATPVGADQTVSNITLTNASGKARVTFNVATDSGPVTDLSLDSIRFYLADLVPAGTATGALPQGTFDSDYFERWAYERSSTAGAVLNTSDAANGNYSYTFVTGFGSAAALAEAPEYSATHQQRLVIRISGTSGVTANTVGIMDITAVPAAGQTATEVAAADQRVYAAVDGCTHCHGAHMEKAAHAGGYLDTRACVVCHSPLGHYGDEMQADDAYLSVFIHKIHSAIDVPAFDNRILGNGYVDVTYPQEPKNCVVCHSGASTQVDNWKDHPTMEVCSSCHTTIDFATGASFVGLDGVTKTHTVQTTNANCSLCHPNAGAVSAGVAPIPAVHDTTLTGNEASEFDVAISMTAPINGQFYEAGVDPAPVVTVTLADPATGTPVDVTVYTTLSTDATSAKGTAGGGLSTANLFVYGPRNEAVPVLTFGSSTDILNSVEVSGDGIGNDDGICDPAEAAIVGACTAIQGHSLLLPSTDAQVTTDASGYSYQLMDNLADLEPGTYMVRFEGADYGGVAANDWVTSSSLAITFQVGTATVEPKVSGDGCLNCHGDTIMHLEGTHAHHVPFDTDYCLACHDKSGNHGDYIGNRVHAVHGASATGDLLAAPGSRDWSFITFPQSANNCTICHTNTAAPTPVWRQPDMIVCGGCHGALVNADPAAYTTDITGEIAAAQHMALNGGDIDPLTPPTFACLVCHGDGKIADLFVTHQLVSFPPPVDPNA